MMKTKRAALLLIGLIAAAPTGAAVRIDSAAGLDFASDTGFPIDAMQRPDQMPFGGANSAFAPVYDLDRYGVMSITIAVPEMRTWALTIAGFVLLGGMLRQRARRISFA